MILSKEFLKILKDKKYLLTILSLLILSILVFELDLSLSDNMQLSQNRLYTVLEKQADSTSLDVLSEEIAEFIQIDNAINSDIDMEILVDKYSQDQIDEYLNLKTFYGDKYFINATKIIKQIEMLDRVGDYSNYNQEVLEEIEYLLSNTNKSNRHNYKYLQKLSNIYEKLADTEITKVNNLSVDAYVSANYRELIVLLFMIITAYTLINIEDKSDMFDVLSMSKKGRYTLSKNKLLALLTLATIFTIVNEFLLIVYAMIKFGNFMWLANIQSYHSLISSPYSINVQQLIIYGIGIKILHAILISTFVYGILSVFENKNLAMFIIVLILGIFAYQYYAISDVSTFRNLKYLNLFAFGMYFHLIKNFVFLNLGVASFSWLITTIILLLILSVSLIFISNYLYINYNNIIYIKRFKNTRKKHYLKSTKAFVHEIYKSFVMEGSLLVLALFLLIVGYQSYQVYNEDVSSYSQSVNQYIDKYGGLIDDTFNQHIESEMFYYANIKKQHSQMIAKYNKGEIAEIEYQKYLSEFTAVNYDMNVFESILNRIKYDREYFINTSGYNKLTSQYDYKYDTIFTFLIITTIIIVVSNFFSIDHRSKEAVVYDISYKGFKNRSKSKLINSILLAISLLAFTTFIYYLTIKFKYGLNYNQIPLSNIIDFDVNSIGFKNNPILLELSINQYLLLIFLTRLIGVLFVALSSLFVGYKIKDRSIILLVLSFIFLLPSALVMLGFNFFSNLSVFDLISGNLFYRSNGYLTKLFFVFILVLILITYFVYIINNNKIKEEIYL